MSVPNVVVLGGGFAGLEAARARRRAPVRVTVVDRRNHHLFQPMLYQVATAGLSAPDSLGAYLTFAPRIGLTDEKRNCVSNIHGAGLSYDEAAFKIAWLVRQGIARGTTGVALKDESGTALIAAKPID